MRRRKTSFIFALMLLYLWFSTATPAHAVIPQLLGPLSALASIIPQILAVVGIALLAIFKRETYGMLIFRIREFSSRHKAIAVMLALAIVGGTGWFAYQVFRSGSSPINAKVPPTQSRGQSAPVSDSWSAFRGGVTRTGHLDNIPGPTTAQVVWLFKEEGAVAVDFSSSPTVIGGRVYIGSAQGSLFSSGGMVYCLDANSGNVIWRYSSPIQIFSSPTVVGGRVYIGEGLHHDIDSRLRCLDANSGQELWAFPTASHVESSPFVTQGKVYFGAGEDGVYCVDALEGKEIWHHPSVHVDMSPLVWKGVVYFGTGYGEYRIYAIDANDGKEMWSKAVDYPVWGSPSAHEDALYFGLGNGDFTQSAKPPKGRVIAVNAKNGALLWAYETGDSVLTAVSYHEGFVYFGSRDGHLYALNAANGELRWKSSIGHPIVSSPAVTPDSVYVGANNGAIYCIDISTGNVKWWYDTDEVVGGLEIYSSPAIANGKLYVGSTDRYIFCLGEKGEAVPKLPLEDR